MSESALENIDMSAFGQCLVFTPDAKGIQLFQLWQSQPAIFIFLRHFACIACRAHAAQVWESRSQYEASGGKIVFIGNGQPSFIEKFREDLGLTGALILTDPKRNAFRMVGFRDGFFYVVRPQSAMNAFQLAREGHRQTAYNSAGGTHWQLGGILVVSTAGQATYRYISESLGDFPEEKTLRFIQKNEGI